MENIHVIWSHGKESGPWGSKISRLAETARDMGFYVDSIDYRGIGDPQQRVEKLLRHCRELNGPIVLAGSSMGGFVSACAASFLPLRGLFLLAPALFVPGFRVPDYAPVDGPMAIVHGWDDEVIPVSGSIRYARNFKAVLHLVDGDHRLKANIPELIQYFRLFLERIMENDISAAETGQ